MYNFANVGLKPERKVWNIFVYLYNKSPKIWWTRCGIREFGMGYKNYSIKKHFELYKITICVFSYKLMIKKLETGSHCWKTFICK